VIKKDKEELMKLATSIQFNGNCEEAFHRYIEIFGGKAILLWRIDEKNCPSEKMMGKVMHAELQIGDYYIYMSDLDKAFDPSVQNLHLNYEADTLTQAQNVFEGLSRNGSVKRPLELTSWGSYLGYVIDEFGVEWDIAFD
jgi:PhnB protein